MSRWIGLGAGAAAFAAAHLVESAAWPWFSAGAAHAPWFLNAGAAVAFTAALLAAAAALVSAADPADAVRRGADVAAGALIALVVFFASVGGFTGTIFPIALVFGAAIIVLSCAGGAAFGWGVRRMRRSGGV